jgi:hypothetical protein
MMDDNTCARVLLSLANGHYPSKIIDEAAYVRATLAHHRVELAAQREMWYIMSDVMINGHGEYPHTRLVDANVRRKRAHASVASPASTARLQQHEIAMGMRMCPLSQTPVPQLFSPNYTLR